MPTTTAQDVSSGASSRCRDARCGSRPRSRPPRAWAACPGRPAWAPRGARRAARPPKRGRLGDMPGSMQTSAFSRASRALSANDTFVIPLVWVGYNPPRPPAVVAAAGRTGRLTAPRWLPPPAPAPAPAARRCHGRRMRLAIRVRPGSRRSHQRCGTPCTPPDRAALGPVRVDSPRDRDTACC